MYWLRSGHYNRDSISGRRRFYWHFVLFIELFFNYAALIEFVDGHTFCGQDSQAMFWTEAVPRQGVLAEHRLKTRVGLCLEFKSGL